MTGNEVKSANQAGVLRRWSRWLERAALGAAALLLFHAVLLLLGFVPVNRAYVPPPAQDCVRIFVRCNEVHTDLVLPVVCEEADVDWRRTFPLGDYWGNVRKPKYVAIGWGNREFYVNTPTWKQFKLSSACGALFWPSETVLHVEYLNDVAPGEHMQPVLLTREQYGRLAAFVKSSVGESHESGAACTATEISYGRRDRFYVAGGRYHLFNTCNQWTGRGLKTAGVPTGMWTPLKQQVLYWLPEVAN
jgi:uncharacterized protein (TIGR02117 family)